MVRLSFVHPSRQVGADRPYARVVLLRGRLPGVAGLCSSLDLASAIRPPLVLRHGSGDHLPRSTPRTFLALPPDARPSLSLPSEGGGGMRGASEGNYCAPGRSGLQSFPGGSGVGMASDGNPNPHQCCGAAHSGGRLGSIRAWPSWRSRFSRARLREEGSVAPGSGERGRKRGGGGREGAIAAERAKMSARL
jgi:hypothetical protein